MDAIIGGCHIYLLTQWGRVTHICVSDLTIIGPDNGLSPGRRQAIIRTNAGILLIRPLGTNFSEFLIEILLLSFKKMRLIVSSAKRRPLCLGLNVLMLTNDTYWPAYTLVTCSLSTVCCEFRAILNRRSLSPNVLKSMLVSTNVKTWLLIYG